MLLCTTQTIGQLQDAHTVGRLTVMLTGHDMHFILNRPNVGLPQLVVQNISQRSLLTWIQSKYDMVHKEAKFLVKNHKINCAKA